MPVYGGIRAKRRRTRGWARTREVERVEKEGKQSKRIYPGVSGYHWQLGRTPLRDVERKLRLPIREWVHERAQKRGPQKILDWGCENGKAIQGLADETPGESICVGYSKERYRDWMNSPNVNYIHATKEDLFRYIRRIKFDLIYSHSGLHHLRNVIPLELARYLVKLTRHLTEGGEIVFSPFFNVREYNGYMAQSSRYAKGKERLHQQLYQGIIDPTKQRYVVKLEENIMRIQRVP